MIYHIWSDLGARPLPQLADGGERPSPLRLYDNGPKWSLIDWGERGNHVLECAGPNLSLDAGERGQIHLLEEGPGWNLAEGGDRGKSIFNDNGPGWQLFGPPEGNGSVMFCPGEGNTPILH